MFVGCVSGAHEFIECMTVEVMVVFDLRSPVHLYAGTFTCIVVLRLVLQCS